MSYNPFLSVHKYLWKKQKPDHRDKRFEHMFKVVKSRENTLPSSVNLCKQVNVPEAYDQGDLGSCTANGLAFCYQFDEIKQVNKNIFTPSRLFIYYNERELEGTTSQDSGANIRDGIKTINSTGICKESLWSYDITKFTVKPPEICYTEAKKYTSTVYATVDQTETSLKTVLNSGYPIVFGFYVFQSFENKDVANTGIMPVPNTDTEMLLGGHCVVIVGYDDSKKAFLIRNSWGNSWGCDYDYNPTNGATLPNGGYFLMPYSCVLDKNISTDFWVVSKVTDPSNLPDPAPVPLETEKLQEIHSSLITASNLIQSSILNINMLLKNKNKYK